MRVRRVLGRILVAALIVALAGALLPRVAPVPAYASNLDDLQRELDELQKQMDELLRKINSSDRQEAEVLRDLATIERQLDKTQSELRRLEGDLSHLEGEIEVATEELAAAEELLAQRQDYLGRRIRTIYENGTVGYLEVLLGSKSFGDFLNRFQFLRQIVIKDNELLELVKEERAEIAQRKTDLEGKRHQAILLQEQAVARRASIEYQQEVKAQYLSRVREDRDLYKKALDEIEETSRQLEDEIRRLDPWGTRPTGKLLWPTTSTRITSYFAMRFHPILRRYRMHNGLDIGAPTGSRIFAAEWGIVRKTGNLGGYGLTVMVDHGGGIWTLYAHMSRIAANVGDTVARGEVIGYVGSTGWSTGPHLHFEVRDNGKPVNPLGWLR